MREVTCASSPESVSILSSLTDRELLDVYELPIIRMSRELSFASALATVDGLRGVEGESKGRIRIIMRIKVTILLPIPPSTI